MPASSAGQLCRVIMTMLARSQPCDAVQCNACCLDGLILVLQRPMYSDGFDIFMFTVSIDSFIFTIHENPRPELNV